MREAWGENPRLLSRHHSVLGKVAPSVLGRRRSPSSLPANPRWLLAPGLAVDVPGRRGSEGRRATQKGTRTCCSLIGTQLPETRGLVCGEEGETDTRQQPAVSAVVVSTDARPGPLEGHRAPGPSQKHSHRLAKTPPLTAVSPHSKWSAVSMANCEMQRTDPQMGSQKGGCQPPLCPEWL